MERDLVEGDGDTRRGSAKGLTPACVVGCGKGGGSKGAGAGFSAEQFAGFTEVHENVGDLADEEDHPEGGSAKGSVKGSAKGSAQGRPVLRQRGFGPED